MTLTGLALALAGAASSPKKSLPFVAVLAFALWASLGPNAGFAQLLFLARFPGVSMFRQWYHFVAFADLALSALGALGFLSLLRLWDKRRRERWTGTAACALISVLMAAEGVAFLREYSSRILPHTEQAIPRLGRDAFLSTIRSGGFSEPWSSALMVYAEESGAPAEMKGAAVAPPLAVSGNGRAGILPTQSYTITPRGAALRAELPEASLIVLPFAYRLDLRASLSGAPVPTAPAGGGSMTAVQAPAGPVSLELSMPPSAFPALVGLQWLALVCCAGWALLLG